ncbi:NHLP leader peptide family RiPP precursor [Pannonibacter sp. Pt2]|uniref:NHLP leader peptide family RiPP n=1 Tax=Pannonibacter anstelovis TaxID=3121537 RepID=A0ABU7ZH82_9HYPH
MDMMPDARQTLETAIRRRAGEDAAFRNMLLTDTKALLEEVFGAQGAPGLQIKVIEEQPGEVVLVLPAVPAGHDELSAQDLDKVSGGMPSQAEIMALMNSPARAAAFEALVSHINNAARGKWTVIGNMR